MSESGSRRRTILQEFRRQPQFVRPSLRASRAVVNSPSTSVDAPVQRHRAPALLILGRCAVQVLEQMQCLPVAKHCPVDGFFQAVIEQAMKCFEIGRTDGKAFDEVLRKRLHQLS